MAGCDLTPPRDTMRVTPPPEVMTRLQRLHAAATHLAETAPEIIANPDAARGLEQALTQAMVGCLRVGSVNEDSVAQRQHELIMRRFHRVLEGEAGSIALRYGNLQADRGLRADFGNVLPAAAGSGAKTLLGAAPLASGAAGIARGGA